MSDYLKRKREEEERRKIASKAGSGNANVNGQTLAEWRKNKTATPSIAPETDNEPRNVYGQTLSEWRKMRNEGGTLSNLDKWKGESENLLREYNKYSYSGDYQTQESHDDFAKKIQKQLENTISLKKKYGENIGEIEEIAGRLSSASRDNDEGLNFFSQWDNDETYQQFLRYQKENEEKQKAFSTKGDTKDTVYESTEIPKYQEWFTNTGINPIHSQYAAKHQNAQRNKTDTEKVQEELEKRNAFEKQKQEEREREKTEILKKAEEVAAAPDFEEKSQYAKTGGKDWLDIEDASYEYINDIESKYKKTHGIGAVDLASNQAKKGYGYIEDKERKIYNYIYATDGKEEAEKYLDALGLTRRMTEDSVQRAEKYATEHPVLSSAETVVSNLVHSGEGFTDALGQRMRGEAIDPYSYGNLTYNTNNAIRQTVSENIDSPVGSFVYQTGMSMADFLATSATTGMMGNLGLNAEMAASLIMGSNAATGGVIEAKQRGASDEDALLTGILQGSAEIVFEKISLEQLKMFSQVPSESVKGVVTNILKGSFTEGSEEVFTSIANAITDQIVNGDLSAYSQNIQSYIQQGFTEEEAKKQAATDFAKQLGLDFLGGGLSGGIMSGGVSTLNYAFNKNGQNTETLPEETTQLNEVETENTETTMQEQPVEEVEEIPWEEAGMYSGEYETNTKVSEKQGVAPAQPQRIQNEFKTVKNNEAAQMVDTVLQYGEADDEVAVSIVKNNAMRAALEEKTGVKLTGTEEQQKKTVKEAVRVYGEGKGSTVSMRQNNPVVLSAGQNATVRGQGVEIVGIKGESGSNPKFEASDGKEYTAEEIKFKDGTTQKLYGAAAQIAMVSDAETANSFVQHYETSMPIQYYAAGFDRFYSLGRMGVPQATVLKTLDAFVSATSDAAMLNAWNLGFKARQNEGVAVKKEQQKRKGKGTYEDQTRNLNENAILQTLVANRTGIDIKRVAGTDDDANAYFVPSMMQIVISEQATNEYAALLHELGEFGLAYDRKGMKELQSALLKYWAEKNGIRGIGETNAIIKRYQQLYAEKEGSKTYEQAIDEMVNDALTGLFSSDEGVEQFLNWLKKDSGYSVAEQRSIVQRFLDMLDKIISYLKDIVKEGHITAAARRTAELEVERAQELREMFLAVLDTAIENANTTGEYESDTRVKHHVSDKFSEEIDAVLNGTMPSGSQVKARDYTPAVLVQNKVKDLPMLITQKHVKTVIYTEAEAKSKGIKVKKDDNYHGLGKELFIKAIDNLDDPVAMYKTKDDTFLVVTELKDSKGDEIVVPIKIKAIGNYNGLFINENQIKSVYGRKKLKQYLQENHFKQIYKKKRTALKERVQYSNLSDSSNSIVTETDENATPKRKYSFAGVEAATADKSMLELANEMEQRGEDSETIRKHTGWHRGYDEKWRFEIDDSQMEILDIESDYMKLDQLLKHDKLFEAYPILREMDAMFLDLGKYANGYTNKQAFTIVLNSNLKKDKGELKRTLIHEIQHAIQYEEGFANGTSVKYWERKLQNGYVAPNRKQKRKQELRKQYLELKEAEPEFVAEMEKHIKAEPTVPRGRIDWTTLEQIEEDPMEWQEYDAEIERLYEKYGERYEELYDLIKELSELEYQDGRDAKDLYYDTAGELEARETAERLLEDEADRKKYPPRSKYENLDRDNVVFADARYSLDIDIDAEIDYFGVGDKLNDYIGVQKAVLEKLPVEYYQDVINMETGMKITIGRKGIKETLSSGKRFQTLPKQLKKMKIATLRRLPELLEKSVLTTDNASNIHNMSPLFSYFETDVHINGKEYRITFDVKKTSAKNHFWMHCVRINEKDSALLTSAPEGQKIHETQNPSEGRITNEGEDVKRSIPIEEIEELQRKHENTLRENDIFRHMVEYLTRSIEVTQGTVISQKSVEKVSNKMIRRYKSEADKTQFMESVDRLFKMMSDENVNTDDFLYFAEEAIRPVLERSKDNKQISDYAKEILDTIRKTPIKLGKMAKQESAYHYGSYNDFRRKLFGRVTVSEKGTDLDSMWQEWSKLYPELFDAETVAEDQPVRLAEIIDALKEDYDSEVGFNLDEAVTYAAMELMEEYAKLPEVKALTAAQDMAQMQRNLRKLNEEYRQKYEQELRELKAEHKETVARQEAKFRVRMSQSRGNRLETQERKKYKDNIVKSTKEIMKWLETNNDKYHVPEVLRETTIGFLGGMDFMSEKGWNNQDTIMLQNRLNVLYRKLSAEAAKTDGADVMADIDPDFLPTLDGLISLLEQSGEIKKIGDMDSRQLKDVAYLVGTLKRVITTANRLIANKQYQHVSQMGDATVSFLAQLKAKKQKGKWIGMGDELLNLHMLDSKSFFEQMGDAAGSLWNEIREGFNKRTWKLESAKKYMEETIRETEIKNWTGKKAELHSFDYNGQQFELTTGQLMCLYLLSKRPQAYNHLMAGATMQSETGGFTIDTQSTVKGQKMPERRIKVTDTQMKEMFKRLTTEQIRIAKAMQKFLAKDCAQWGNEVSMTMYGYKKFGETTYWPIKTNENFNKTDDKNAETGTANTSLYAIRNQGMTKNLVKNANNPIVVGDAFDVFAEHVANMANYNAFVIPLSDAMKWFNYRSRTEEGLVTGSIKEEMERSYGKGAKRYFLNFIKDVNGEVKKGVASEISSTFTSKYKAAAVGANLRVVIQQPTSILRTMSVMNPKYLVQGLAHGSAVKEMHENSAIAIWKSWGYFETGLGQSMKQVITGEGTTFEKIVEGSMAGAGLADDITWGVIWNAVKAEIHDKNKDIDSSSEEYKELVRKRFDEVIDQTQVVDTVLHKSQIMRSGDGVVKMAVSFMAEPTKSYNLLRSAVRELNQNNNTENRTKVARRAFVYAFTGIITAAFASILDAFRDDDEEKEWAEKWIENFKANSLENINPVSQIPYLKDLSSLWQGYDSSRMDMAGISTLVNAVQQAIKYANRSSKKTLYGVTKNIIKGLSQVTGIPLYNALRDTESLIEQFTFAPFDEERITGKDVRIRLLRAMNEGNEVQLRKYLAWYNEKYQEKITDGKTDKEARAALKSSITSQWKPIYQNSTTAEKIKIKQLLLKISVNGQQLYKDYDWSNWDEKK